MQSNKGPSLFGNSDEDARFLEMIQDSSRRQERLRVLERRRMLSTWLLFVYVGLLLVLAVAALTSSNPSFFFFPVAFTTAIAAGTAARQSDADAQIKMIKLYVLLTQSSDRAT